jgi:hypothetical protein
MERPAAAPPIRQLVVGAGLLVAVVVEACVPAPAGRTAVPPPTPARSQPAGPTPSPTVALVRPTPTPLPTFLVHTVAAGDSLGKLARQYGTTGRSIAFWNRTAYPSLDPASATYNPNDIKVGWTLQLIPGATFDGETITQAPTPTPRPTPTPPDVIGPGG